MWFYWRCWQQQEWTSLSKQRRRRPTRQQHSSNLALTSNSRKKNSLFCCPFFRGGVGRDMRFVHAWGKNVADEIQQCWKNCDVISVGSVQTVRRSPSSWVNHIFVRLQTKHCVFSPFHINTMPILFHNLNYLMNFQIFNAYVTEYLQNRIQPHSQDHFLGWGPPKKPRNKFWERDYPECEHMVFI